MNRVPNCFHRSSLRPGAFSGPVRHTLILSLIAFSWQALAAPGPIIVGHRGTTQFAPENTLAGFDAAIAHGAQLLEMDLRTSADGEIVVIHDATVDRTTDGTGLVKKLTLEELKALDAGAWFDARFAGERIPTFEETLAAIKGRALPDLDLKDADPEKVVEILKRHGMASGVTVYSGNWRTLAKIKALAPELMIRPTIPQGERPLDRLMETLDPEIVNIDWEDYSRELVREIQARGRKAFVNTMQAREKEAAAIEEALHSGADYIQSDRLDELVKQAAAQAKSAAPAAGE